MKSNELLGVLEQVAPVALSDEFCKKCSFYDNSGIIIDGGDDIRGALFSLDLSPKAVEQAKKLGYNAIVTHHPAIYGGIERLNANQSPLAYALYECVKRGITVISMHLNFDAAPRGIDYYLMRGVGGEQCKTLINLENGAYGRVYDLPPVTLGELAERVAREFNTQRLIVYGDKNKTVGKAASFCGAGCDDNTCRFAVENNADAVISSDMPHHRIADFVGRGTGIILLTHYASEAYGFGKIYKKIMDKLSVPSSFFCDGDLL